MLSSGGWKHKTKNGKYFISTVNVVTTGWETMVFPIVDGTIDYSELEAERHDGENSAYAAHIQMISKWEAKD